MTPILGIVMDNLHGRHSGPRATPLWPVRRATLDALRAEGLVFVQYSPLTRLPPQRARDAGLEPVAALSWNLLPGDGGLEETLARARDAGFSFGTILAGGNLLELDEALRRAERLLEAQARAGFRVLLETHRGTLTESIPRTTTLVERFPELEFNLDLSHWFVTHRLDRVSVERFLAATAPVLTRVGFLHGRVSSGADVQVPLAGATHLPFFLAVWRHLATRRPGLHFAPELLPSTIGYAQHPEPSDRWLEAKLLLDAARVGFAC